MAPKAIRLHERDLRLFEELAEVGLLDTATCWHRHFPADRTGKACLRRLRLLVAHDLLAAIPVTVSFGNADGGRSQRIFRLTERGAEVLASLRGTAPLPIPRRDPRPETLLHRLGIAKLRLTVNDACRLQHLPQPRWIGEHETVPGVRPDATFAERFVLCERFPVADGSHVTCWPDASCRLQIPDPSATSGNAAHHLVIYWEYDRATEVLRQVARKVPGYAALLASGAFRKHWPVAPEATVRVFFVAPSEQRMRNVARAIKDIAGAALFRLAIASELTAKDFFTAPCWHTVQGERRAILRAPAPTASVTPTG